MRIIFTLLDILSLLIIVDAVLSWMMPNRDQFPRNITAKITEPLYAPIRAILSPEKTGGMDFSPLIVLLLIHLLRSALA